MVGLLDPLASDLAMLDNAVLVIRATGATPAPSIAEMIGRWRAHRAGRSKVAPASSLKLEIDDLRGRRYATFDPAGTVTRLLLPVGTYIVTATLSGRRRSYTLALQSGATSELEVSPSLA